MYEYNTLSRAQHKSAFSKLQKRTIDSNLGIYVFLVLKVVIVSVGPDLRQHCHIDVVHPLAFHLACTCPSVLLQNWDVWNILQEHA